MMFVVMMAWWQCLGTLRGRVVCVKIVGYYTAQSVCVCTVQRNVCLRDGMHFSFENCMAFETDGHAYKKELSPVCSRPPEQT